MSDANAPAPTAAPVSARGLAVTLGDGSQALALRFDGDVLALVCDRAHPPGRPLEFRFETSEGELRVGGKTAGSKQRDDLRYDVRVRLHSLRREQRAWLNAQLGADRA